MSKKPGRLAKASATASIISAIFGSAGQPSYGKQASDYARGSHAENKARVERVFNRRQDS